MAGFSVFSRHPRALMLPVLAALLATLPGCTLWSGSHAAPPGTTSTTALPPTAPPAAVPAPAPAPAAGQMGTISPATPAGPPMPAAPAARASTATAAEPAPAAQAAPRPAASKLPATASAAAGATPPGAAKAPVPRPAPAVPKPAAPKPVVAAATAAAPAVAKPSQSSQPSLDLAALEQRLKDTKAIGVFTKLSLKNQVDDLLDEFKKFHQGGGGSPPPALRSRYDLLMIKVLSLLQDGDPQLASSISSSREALWDILKDPNKFAKI